MRAELASRYDILQVTTSGCRPSLVEVAPDKFGACNRSNEFALKEIKRTAPQLVVIAQVDGHEKTDWIEVASNLRALGAGAVVLVGSVPQWEDDLYKLVAMYHWDDPGLLVREGLRRDLREIDESLEARFALSSDVHYVRIGDLFCDDRGCNGFIGPDRRTDILTWDYGHLTPKASEYVSRQVLAAALISLMPVSVKN